MTILKIIKNLFKKPVTLKEEKVFENSRGTPTYFRKKCILCGLCVINCPTKAIDLIREEHRIKINLAECIFCGACSEVCPTKAIEMAPENPKREKKISKLVVE